MKLFDNIKAEYSLDCEVYTTDTTGTDYVDTIGFSDGMLMIMAGDIATTDSDRYTITLKESDTTNGTYSSTGISVVFTEDEDNTIKVARVANLNTTRKRYLRADLTCSATTISFEGGVALLLGEKDSGPVNED